VSVRRHAVLACILGLAIAAPEMAEAATITTWTLHNVQLTAPGRGPLFVNGDLKVDSAGDVIDVSITNGLSTFTLRNCQNITSAIDCGFPGTDQLSLTPKFNLTTTNRFQLAKDPLVSGSDIIVPTLNL
jgi:hypothetical protein